MAACKSCRTNLIDKAAEIEAKGHENVSNPPGLKQILDKADELEAEGHENVHNSPGRVRQFEQIKMIDRELYKMSESDLKKAREDVMKMMKKYRE